jgi:hypothetical protein
VSWLVLAALALAVLVYVGRRGIPVRPRKRAGPRLTRDEALSLLGLNGEAGPAEIDAAWRRLMLRAHPDHGGTSGLVAQLNAARERLINKN